jgi:hypothetical protein
LPYDLNSSAKETYFLSPPLTTIDVFGAAPEVLCIISAAVVASLTGTALTEEVDWFSYSSSSANLAYLSQAL